MKNIAKLFLITTFFASLISSCRFTTSKWYLPNGRVFGYIPKTNNEVYKHGWRDGCESGMATGFNKEFGKSFYTFKKDIRFSGFKYGDKRDLFFDKEITPSDQSLYTRVWWDMYKACRDYQGGAMKAPAIAGSMSALPGDPAGRWDDPTLMYEFNAWNNGNENIAFW